jgi:hypothetical protein
MFTPRSLPRPLAAFRTTLAAAFLGALGMQPGAGAPQEPAAEPRRQHEILAASVGAWDLEFHTQDSAKGTSQCEMQLGGLWLVEHVRTECRGAPYEGRGTTSYDPARNCFVQVWIDSTSPRPLVTEGTYDAATKTLTLTGDVATPDGATARAVLVTVFRADARTFAFRMVRPDGSETELFRIDYTRRR